MVVNAVTPRAYKPLHIFDVQRLLPRVLHFRPCVFEPPIHTNGCSRFTVHGLLWRGMSWMSSVNSFFM